MKISKMTLLVLLTGLMVAGSASADWRANLGSLGQALKGSVTEHVAMTAGMVPGSERAGNSPSGYTNAMITKLSGVLHQSQTINGRRAEWPKVVITDLQIPPNQEYRSGFRVQANECILFNAVLWTDAKSSENFDKLALCAGDLPRDASMFVVVWRNFPVSGENTGDVRTIGPVPPYNKLPTDAGLERWMTSPFGTYYISSLLTVVLGYDQNSFTIDDRRFWVRNLKGM